VGGFAQASQVQCHQRDDKEFYRLITFMVMVAILSNDGSSHSQRQKM